MFKQLRYAMPANPCRHGGMHGTQNREWLAPSARISRGCVTGGAGPEPSLKKKVGVGWHGGRNDGSPNVSLPRIREHVTLHGNGDVAGVIKFGEEGKTIGDRWA